MNVLKSNVADSCLGGGETNYKAPLNGKLSVQRSAVFALLAELANDNGEFFKNTTSWPKYASRLEKNCHKISSLTLPLEEDVKKLQDMAPRYDYDKLTPGNGFRSLVCVCDTVVLHLISVLRSCIEHRQTMMFRVSYYCKEVESYCAVLKFLVSALQMVIDAAVYAPDNCLFPDLSGDYTKYQAVLDGIEVLDPSCFYGRPLGFQFPPSVGRIFRLIGVILAIYSLSWEKGRSALGSFLNSPRFILSPEQRAKRIVKVTREADIEFCRSFWNLSEFGSQVPRIFCPNMAINELREINWVGSITMATTNGGTVKIPEPSSYTGHRPVKIRVLSYCHRQILSPAGSQNQLPPSPYLLFHCHGGGYVATTSKSHETYLRLWAKLLNCSIVSVEYSLAPENPFPRPTEEVLYAYAYIINNAAQLGWTGEKICMIGDSAGGNLIMSVSLKLVQLGVKRIPDGIITVYTPFLFQFLIGFQTNKELEKIDGTGCSLPTAFTFTNQYLYTLVPSITFPIAELYGSSFTYGSRATVCCRSEQKDSERSGHKSLQEYVKQVQKIQQDDALCLEGSSSIVSLVNLADIASTAAIRSNASTVLKRENEQGFSDGNNSEGDEDDDNSCISGVQVKSDPLHIHLSSNMYDERLVDYLKIHPLTKNTLILMNQGNCIESRQEEKILNMEESKRPSRVSKLAAFLCSPSAPVSKELPSETATSVRNFSRSRFMLTSLSSHSIVTKNEYSAHKRTLSQSLADTAAMAAGHALDNISDWLEKSAPLAPVDKSKLDRAASLSPIITTEMGKKIRIGNDCNKSYISDIKRSVPRDPLISPIYATPEDLARLPPAWFVACHLDPLLDDTITFAKKMRDAGGRVMALDLLDNLPHGFLNFTLVSSECREGAKICLDRVKEAFGITDTSVSSWN
uniref:Hormone-sensitive lipase n=1 Tax=Setaria digitata TaxID=48799 RepID=A0A915PGC5_9BILA